MRQKNTHNPIRYQVLLPEELHSLLRSMADEQQTSIADLIRTYVRFGIQASRKSQSITSKDRDSEQQLLIM